MRIPHRFFRHVSRTINRTPQTPQNINGCLTWPGDAKGGNAGGDTAVLIDAENVSHKSLSALMAEVTKDGTANVRRIYGDWTSPNMRIWRDGILRHAVVPIQQFAYAGGKNSSDGAMMLDAMDLLYSDRFSRFCLVTSDSDFTRLATRIREQGLSVHGFGGKRHTTHHALVAACNKFSYLEELAMPSDKMGKQAILVASPESAASSRTLVTPASPSTSWKPIFDNSSPTSTTQLLSASQSETHLTHNPAIPREKPLDRAAIESIRVE
jgi:hypothetical protein